MRALAVSALAMILAAGSVHARAPKDAELTFIQTIYAHYLGEQNDDADHIDSLDEIEKRASKSLRKALRLENRCVMKTQEVCAIDADIAINAQDWLITDVNVVAITPAHETTKTIRAEFKNMGRNTRIDYLFILEDGAWKVDEVEAKDFNNDGSENMKYAWRLKESIIKRLKQFDESRLSFLHRT